MMKRILREEYLNWLIRWKDQQIIKVVSGVRRCGKSTMFAVYRDYLLQNGVEEGRIFEINFEDVDFEELTDYRKLYDYLKPKIVSGQMNYIFLDEIQHVEQFEKAVDSLFIKENVDVYITGSNAYFMSGELATLLSGRCVELKMLPLSFKEFVTAYEDQGLSKIELFNLYVRNGSFPYISKYQIGQEEARMYLRDIYNSILLKDVVARLKTTDVTALENITKFLMHNIGNRLSPAKIANTLKSQQKGVDSKTVGKYIRGLTDSLLLYEASRYNIKGKQFLSTQSKYYTVDIGLRNMLVKEKDSDIGHILENIVYLELLRRGYDVYVGDVGDVEDGEVDFVAINGEGTIYYQVSATTLDDSVLKRELEPFKKIRDNYPKYLLTLDEIFGTGNYEGILKVNALDWLLGKR